jgi:hypothetical protein
MTKLWFGSFGLQLIRPQTTATPRPWCMWHRRSSAPAMAAARYFLAAQWREERSKGIVALSGDGARSLRPAAGWICVVLLLARSSSARP